MCGTLGHECGTTVDECGLTLECGECAKGESCVMGVCRADDTAGLTPEVVAATSAEVTEVRIHEWAGLALTPTHLRTMSAAAGGGWEWGPAVSAPPWPVALADDGERAFVLSAFYHPAADPDVFPTTLTAYSIGPGEQPVQLGKMSLPFGGMSALVYRPARLALHDDRIFVIGRGRGPVVVDVADPGKPKLLSKGLADLWSLQDLQVDGNRLWLLDGLEGLRVLDTDFAPEAEPLGSLGLPGFGTTFDAEGGLLLVSGSAGEVYVIDGTDPAGLTVQGTAQCGAGPVRAVQLDPPFAYVLHGAAGQLAVIDLTDAGAPMCRGSLPAPGATRLSCTSGQAAVASGFQGLRIVELADPDAPTELQRLFLPYGRTAGGMLAGQTGYVAGTAGFAVWDLSNPADPAWIAGLPLPGEGAEVAGHEGRVFALSHAPTAGMPEASWLTEVDFSSPSAPGPSSVELPAGAGHLVAGQDAIYLVAQETAGGAQVLRLAYEASKGETPTPYIALAETPLALRSAAPGLVVGWTAPAGLPAFGFHLVEPDILPDKGVLAGTFSLLAGGGRPPEMGLAVAGKTVLLGFPLIPQDGLGGVTAVGIKHPATPELLSASGWGGTRFLCAGDSRSWSMSPRRGDLTILSLDVSSSGLPALDPLMIASTGIPGGPCVTEGGFLFCFGDTLSIVDVRPWIGEVP